MVVYRIRLSLCSAYHSAQRNSEPGLGLWCMNSRSRRIRRNHERISSPPCSSSSMSDRHEMHYHINKHSMHHVTTFNSTDTEVGFILHLLHSHMGIVFLHLGVNLIYFIRPVASIVITAASTSAVSCSKSRPSAPRHAPAP